ncbi:unnamed protein product, partial [Prorocentrum cordatum]
MRAAKAILAAGPPAPPSSDGGDDSTGDVAGAAVVSAAAASACATAATPDKTSSGYEPGGPEDKLFRYCAAKWSSGLWNSKDLATLSQLVGDAGGRGLEKFAVPLGSRGSNHSRKIQTALGVRDLSDVLYYADVPVYNADKNVRESMRMPIRLPVELLYFCWKETPQELDLGALDPEDYRTSQYTSHPIVRAQADGSVVPVGLYTDKVA